MGEKCDIVGDGRDEDMVDDEIGEQHDIVGEMRGVNIGENIGICGSESTLSVGKVCASMAPRFVG